MVCLTLAQVLEAGAATTIFGVVLLAAGIGITRMGKTTFFDQLSLALVFAGNALVVLGVAGDFQEGPGDFNLSHHSRDRMRHRLPVLSQ